jgi:hypothetical protein
MHWWGRLLAVALFFIAFLARSGGGLGPSSVCGWLDGLYSMATWITLLALPVLFVIALVSSVAKVVRTSQKAIPDTPLPPYEQPSVLTPSPTHRGELRRLVPAALVVAGFGFILFGPSGCVPFRVCDQSEVVSPESGSGRRFSGELPQVVSPFADLSAYTATFQVNGPWELRWSSTADRVRIDVFTAEAVQTGRYFPEAGHTYVDDPRPQGSTTMGAGGTFCVRIELHDETYESAESSYYSTSRPAGPTPVPRRMSWEIVIAAQ